MYCDDAGGGGVGGVGGGGESVQADVQTDCSHVSSPGGSSGQTGPGTRLKVTAHAGAEQTQHRPGQQPLLSHHWC